MGVPASEVCYTSATTGRGDHEVHKGHVVALGKNTVFPSKTAGWLYLEVSKPVPVAALSKAWVCDRSLVGVAG
jgi:hypothetical protein